MGKRKVYQQVWDRVRNQVWHQVKDQAYHQVEREVEAQIGLIHPAWLRVGRQVMAQVEEDYDG